MADTLENSFLLNEQTHFRSSNKPKAYMKSVQDDPKEERKRKDAVKSFNNRAKMDKKKRDLELTFEHRTEEVTQLRQQRAASIRNIENLKRQLSSPSMSGSEGWNTSPPEDYSFQQDPHHYPAASSSWVEYSSGIDFAANGTAPEIFPNGMQLPSANSQYQSTTQGQGYYGEPSYDLLNQADCLPNSLGAAPRALGHTLDYMDSSSQEIGAYEATPYNPRTVTMPAGGPSDLVASTLHHTLSASDQYFQEYENPSHHQNWNQY